MMDEIVPESRLSFAINEDARDLWLARREAASRLDEQIYFQFATRFLELGENLLAFDAAQEGLQCWPDSLELLNSKALSLARSGAYREANVLLENLYAKGASDHETVGLLARTYKDLWEAAKTPNQGAPFLRRALALYEKTYLETGAYWFGINAATLAVAKGDLSLARTYASQIRNSLIPLLEIDNLANENRYWMLATLGESALIEGDLPAAEEWYARALTSSSAGSGSIASSRRNAKLLASYGCCKISFVNKVLPQARICVFSGHRADSPNRAEPRLPRAAEELLYLKIKETLRELNVGIGFSSVAKGADILFLEAMLELGGEINVVLPFPDESFVPMSVAIEHDDRWLARFQRLLDAAKTVSYASGFYTGDASFTYGNLILYGKAKSYSRQIDGTVIPLTVWDGREGSEGGTSTNVAGWLASGEKVHVISPDGCLSEILSPLPLDGLDHKSPNRYWSTAHQANNCQLVSFLFGDIVGYSKLSESEILPFVEYCLGGIADLIEKSEVPPITRNTWGDGIYFVFPSARSAGALALQIVERMAATNWTSKGLPANLQIRIGLHSGPAYAVEDPIVKQVTYCGYQVSHAARLEPITPPGQVYCSEEFAALCEAENVTEFRLTYVGKTSLAKNFGTFPAYRLNEP